MTTEIYFNGQLAYFDKEEVIVGSYALNKIGDLKSRQGTATNTYTLPFVKQNKAIFSDAELIQNEGTGPYSKYTHEVFIEGISVFKGSAYVTESWEGYKIQAIAGNSDFYVLLKDNSIRDLDFSELDHTRDDATIIASWPNTQGYIYPFIDYGKYQDVPTHSLGSDDSANIVCPADLFPAVFLKTMIQKIADFTGYVFTGTILGNERFIEEILPFSTPPFVQEDTDGFQGIKKSILLSGDPTPGVGTATRYLTLLTTVSDPGSNYDVYGFFNIGHAKYVKVSLDWDNFGDATKLIAVVKRDALHPENNSPYPTVIGQYNSDTAVIVSQAKATLNKTIFVGPGERIFIFLENNNVNSGTVAINAFNIEVVEVDQGYGLVWRFALNLPDIKLDKFLLDFLNRYGLSIDTDNDLKIVNFVSDDQILLNEPVDWSGKIDYNFKPDLFYRFDNYTQTNRLSYKTGDAIPDAREYDFLIVDETLSPAITDAYTSEFALPGIGNAFQGGVQTINANFFVIKPPLIFRGAYNHIAYNPDDVIFYRNGLFKAIPFTTAYVRPVNAPSDGLWAAMKQADVWTIDKGLPLITRLNRLPSGPTVDFQDEAMQEINVFAKDTGMDWPSIWAAHFNVLRRILDKTKIMEQPLVLNYADIANLDLTRPVWFEELGIYFRVDEVRQFKFNQVDSTIVRLIRL